MVRDAALRGAFISLFAFLCGIVRVLVRPDCHQRCHQNYSRLGEAVQIEKLIATVLHEAHEWQVEETMDPLSEGAEGACIDARLDLVHAESTPVLALTGHSTYSTGGRITLATDGCPSDLSPGAKSVLWPRYLPSSAAKVVVKAK